MDEVMNIVVTIKDSGETTIHLDKGIIDRGSLLTVAHYLASLSNVMFESANQIQLH